MSAANEHAGLAALSICEALLLALKDHGLLPEHEIAGVLHDAASTHQNVIGTEPESAENQAVAALIKGIIDGGNYARMP